MIKGFRGLALAAAGAVLAFVLATGCGRQPENQETEDERIHVVTTLFPYYDFVRQIAGDQVRLTLVVPAGMDSHSFEPTPADMITIQSADILICNGGSMEHWLDQVLESLDTSDMEILTMMDYIDVMEEEVVEGMEESEHSHSHEETYEQLIHPYEEDGHEMEIEYDEHIWTSPVNAMKLVEVISQALQEAVPWAGDRIQAATDQYLGDLREIDQGFRQVSADRKRSLFVVADKFPFRYLAEEYDLEYRAAFTGCSSDTEPSAKTIAYLIDKIREEEIPVVYYLELSSHSTARVISEETGARQLLLHSCHNVTRREFDQGVTYLQLMRQNVENLRQGIDE